MKNRKYNLPKHICWDVTCDLYHASFIINRVRYSFKKKTIKEAMECVAYTYYNKGKWDMNKMNDYLNSYTQYEALDNPETRRINDDLNNLPKTKLEMLIKLAKEYDHNKDEISLKYKAISTEAVLNALKGNVNGAKPDLIYSNEEGSFILTFDHVFYNGFSYPMQFLINRHNVKVICNNKTKGIYTIKEFLNFIEDNKIIVSKQASILTYIMADVIDNKIDKHVDKIKEVLCTL